MNIKATRATFYAAFNEVRPNYFSRPALDDLFYYLESAEHEDGVEMDLDIAALCKKYAEATAGEIVKQFGIDVSKAEDELDQRYIVSDWLENAYILVGQNGDKFIYRIR